MELIFATGNNIKFEIARKSMAVFNIKLIQEEIDTPEIQSVELEEIVAFSVKWAAGKLGKPVVVSDVGFFIEALKGFPGPFVKYVNSWLSAEDYLRLMNDSDNRKVRIIDCLGYCKPDSEPVFFSSEAVGNMALTLGRKGYSSMNQLFIPEGMVEPLSNMSDDEMIEFWEGRMDMWRSLAGHLTSGMAF